MRFLVLVLAAMVPAMAMAEQIDFDPQPEVEAIETVEKAETKSQMPPMMPSVADSMDRDIEELFRRVEELERTKIDATEAEEIAEKVFKRLSLVVNKASGGQEMRTVMAKMSSGAVVPVELGPGESLAAISDPSTGQFMQLQQPQMVAVPTYANPVESYRFDGFEVRQSSVLPTGNRNVGIQFMDCSSGQCQPRPQSTARSGFFRR